MGMLCIYLTLNQVLNSASDQQGLQATSNAIYTGDTASDQQWLQATSNAIYIRDTASDQQC